MIGAQLSSRLLHDVKHRGVTAWLLSGVLISFYVVLYFTDALDAAMRNAGIQGDYFLGTLNMVARAVGLDGKWQLYGALYTVGMVVGGAWMLRKYRHNAYQVVRTITVVGVQVLLAFTLPMALKAAGEQEFYVSYFWPLKIEYFYPDVISRQPLPFIVWTVVFGLVLSPLLAVFLGKRWYCSWVCGCGGLANTFGEPWRHLSDKSTTSWKVEKVTIHTVLGISILTTLLAVGSAALPAHSALRETAASFRSWYGLLVGMILSGVVGTGLYPVGGTRVWCRFACPMAALQGVFQKLGTFRITVKEDMCISCGLCSSSCEMGIDVRAYAQSNTSFTRASCVGCGLCAEVCPRGVLRLENTWSQASQLRRLPILQEDGQGGVRVVSSRGNA